MFSFLKFNAEEIRNKRGKSYKEDPTFKDVMHCIVFVIPAMTNLYDPDDEVLNKIKALQQRINGPRNVSSGFFFLLDRKFA